MSHLADLLAPKLPDGMTIPEPLERAWTWMEGQGWGFENRNGYFLTPYAGTAELGIVFSPTESLTGWFEPDEAGYDRLFPLGQTDGTGSFAALWRDPSDAIRVVVLGLPRTTAAWGHELAVIDTHEPGSPADVAALARVMSDVRAAFIAQWGTPRAEAPAPGSWAVNKLEVTWIQHVDLWPVTDDIVVALFTSAEEGTQIAAVVSPAAIDEEERF
ncbi:MULTISPECIES: hypothetical protein [unclassified Pseudoclavibacter]|uniref:hypothetical protein n=1 Tax=unclassified Pseudoclavibacter TaxID=2615177 RepID=UPI001BACEB89|nr:hypothetical protein [Pseudoclavibacter sp. Marseille-Q4354]MBS3177832.1 hypothetical protein [Pseudoclavibacter sp. Marseille-Q4354]